MRLEISNTDLQTVTPTAHLLYRRCTNYAHTDK